MSTYRQKPKPVEAEQFNRVGDDGVPVGYSAVWKSSGSPTGYIVQLFPGIQPIAIGDWLVTDENGKTTVCKDEDFASVYEAGD